MNATAKQHPTTNGTGTDFRGDGVTNSNRKGRRAATARKLKLSRCGNIAIFTNISISAVHRPLVSFLCRKKEETGRKPVYHRREIHPFGMLS